MATTMFTRAASLLTALVALPSMASAEDEWQFRFTPYAWVASLSTDTTIGSGPSTSTDTDLLDVLDFDLQSGLDTLKQLASLSSISTAVPVDFILVFKRV